MVIAGLRIRAVSLRSAEARHFGGRGGMADAAVLKTTGGKPSCGFESRRPYQSSDFEDCAPVHKHASASNARRNQRILGHVPVTGPFACQPNSTLGCSWIGRTLGPRIQKLRWLQPRGHPPLNSNKTHSL